MYFYKWLVRRLHFQGLRSLEMRSLLIVNDEFTDEYNAENGVFLQPNYETNYSGIKEFYYIREIFKSLKINHLFIFGCLFLLSNLHGQNFQGGLLGGLNASRIDGDGHEFYGKLGLNAGAFVAREILPEMLFWQMELKYTSRGKYHLYRTPGGTIVGLDLIDLRYAEMPLSLHYFLNPQVQLELGISPDLLLKERYEDEDGILPVEDANDLRRVGVTAFAGANYFVLESLAVGIRFNYSVIPFYKFDAYAVRYRDSGWFHDVLSVNARYYFTR